ncbi:Acg family FMN-binding oxidoreductase [Compostimonas suwonensis]|uniref:Nitroreductase family protein n=1 Tax=Compostimonas suwonensis TaxID=1048394 RepID=A0A2M9BVZ1_9MICO|nr:hypothetical protein [Compostimonas suwonensis]PJJ62095.1 hypothetical protein CLV54_1888 [Compostimonas suwonensis]
MSPKKARTGRKITMIVVGSVMGVVLISLGAVLTIGGIFVPADYLQPWARTYADQFGDPRMKVVAQAELAPSGHNMQPWTITLDPADAGVLYLYADPTRLTPAVDPFARQTLVSQGTFLEYLRVSAANLGYAADFTLFPNGPYDEADLTASMSALPVAKITLAQDPSASSTDYASLFLSDTNRAPYADTPLSASQIDALEGVAADSGAALQIFTDQKDVKTFGDLGMQGTVIETEYAAATEESDRLFYGNEGAKNTARSGFAVEGQGTSGFMKYLLQGLLAIIPSINDDAAGARNAIAMTAAAVAHTPAYGMISTPANSRTEQVQAGILYAALSLRARTLGLVMQPLSQVLQEYPTMAAPYAAIHRQYAPAGQTIQMLVRIGTPTTQYPTTMRRDAHSLIREP